jgi:hypothetical protein
MTASPAYPRFVLVAAILVAVLGAVAGAFGWIMWPELFFRAYLHGWLLWLGVSLGSLALLMIGNLLGGSWSMAIRRPAEAAALTLPLLAVLFLPIAFAALTGPLFPWANSNPWHEDALLVHRRPYLNPTFFLGRAIVYAGCWMIPAWLLCRRRTSPSTAYALSGPCLLLYVLTMGLFASTDWILSLEPHYKSTVFGLIVIVGQGVSAMCVLIPAAFLMTRAAVDGARLISADCWNDLGTVLLTVTMLWCYLVICQFVVNWMGNTQAENRWYLHRLSYGWYPLSVVLVGVHLVLPFLLLLFRRVKRNPKALLALCIVVLAARGLDGFITINASGGDDPVPLLSRLSWLDFAMPLGIGAAWLAVFLWLLERRPQPMAQPSMEEVGYAVNAA